MSKLEKRIEELEKQIEYENRKMECCGYGKSDLMYLYELEAELEELLELEDDEEYEEYKKSKEEDEE